MAKKNLMLDPEYITIYFSAFTDNNDAGALPIVATNKDTGKRIGRFASIDDLAKWAKKLGGAFKLDEGNPVGDDSGAGYYFEWNPRAAQAERDNRRPIIHGCAGLINSRPADYF